MRAARITQVVRFLRRVPSSVAREAGMEAGWLGARVPRVPRGGTACTLRRTTKRVSVRTAASCLRQRRGPPPATAGRWIRRFPRAGSPVPRPRSARGCGGPAPRFSVKRLRRPSSSTGRIRFLNSTRPRAVLRKRSRVQDEPAASFLIDTRSPDHVATCFETRPGVLRPVHRGAGCAGRRGICRTRTPRCSCTSDATLQTRREAPRERATRPPSRSF